MVGEVETTFLIFLFMCFFIYIGLKSQKKIALICCSILIGFMSVQILRVLLIQPGLGRIELVIKWAIVGLSGGLIGLVSNSILSRVGPLKQPG